MDSLSDTSPLVAVFRVWDRIEVLLEKSPLLPLELCAFAIYFFLLGSSKDVAIVAGLFAWLRLSHLQALLPGHNIFTVFVAGVIVLLIASVFFIESKDHNDSSRLWPGGNPSRLVPCRATQMRLLPKKHSSSYPRLLVGVPVGIDGNVNRMLSVDTPGSPGLLSSIRSPKAWYDVDAKDYLDPSVGNRSLRSKLDGYLKSQGAEPEDFPYAYLVTAPRFLGYQFSPVSFWYLYSVDKILSGMVVEMNNVFGERRAYLLTTARAERLTAGTSSDSDQPITFEATWNKDFHVSPFNSRKGTYNIAAVDPLLPGLGGFRGIDITLNLLSSKGQTKVVTKIASQGEAVDPSSINAIHKSSFLSAWLLNGFLTLPRLIKDYAMLYLHHNLHIWCRPVPLKNTWARRAGTTEAVLEGVFRDYIRHLVDASPNPLIVSYHPSGIPREEQVFQSPRAIEGRADKVCIRVLTPSFYRRFVGYAHDIEAVFCEMAESCTLWADNADVLPKLFVKRPTPPISTGSIVDFLLFKAIHALRARPPAIRRPMTSAERHPPPPRAVDIRDFRISSMDGFVLSQLSSPERTAYGLSVIRQFVADRLVGGHVAVLEVAGAVARLAVVWAAASALANIAEALTP